jgi:type IV pilus assembly protein PilY1
MKLTRLPWLMTLPLFWGAGLTHAGNADLANNPLPVVSSTEPNIMFMLDNSGSMHNIVPPDHYEPTALGLSCSGQRALSNTSAFDLIVLDDGTPLLKQGNNFYTYGTTGTSSNTVRCFASSSTYNARLYGDSSASNNSNCGTNTSCKRPGSYLDASYSGHFLNWYFSSATLGTTDNFGAGSRKKPTTFTRMEVAQSAAKGIINNLSNVRAGLASYNGADGGSLREIIGSLDPAKKLAINGKIDALSPSGSTPLAETLSDIGRYFTTGYSGNLTLHPSAATPVTASVANVFNNHTIRDDTGGQSLATTPIQYWCQKSFAVLVTDGRPQEDRAVSDALCDYLGIAGGTCGTSPYGEGKTIGTGANAGYHVRIVNGITYQQRHEGAAHSYESAGSDYLDDVAGALFDIDLRPDLTKTGGGSKKNNLSTYTIGFADDEAKNDSLLQEAATAGGGLFKTAGNASELTAAFMQATDDIIARDGAAAAVAVANAHVTSTDNASYSTSYNSGSWTGDLVAYPITTATGIPNVSAPIWNTDCASPTAYVDAADTTKGVLGCSAQVKLDAMAPSNRLIVTSKDTVPCNSSCGIPFQPTSASGTTISIAQRDLLNTPGQTDGDAVVSYVRGNANSAYRTRTHQLGDTINAEPLVVREPMHNYSDTGYSAYKSAQASRTKIIIQPANDGMVHAFDAGTGVERWAYIPNLLISNSRDPDNSSTSLLNTRTRKTGFNHYPLIDATPIVADVDFGNTGVSTPGAAAWHTIVVGGLGKGGRGYYALDVTATTAVTEAAATNRVLWEFPNSVINDTDRTAATNDTGYTFGKPVIVKTTAQGWVVLVTSGYNNGGSGDGEAHLYVLNAKTGDLIKDIKTSGCSTVPSSDPCGLAHIAAYVENADHDNTVELVYGGDLYGNVWRFNLSGPSSLWSVSRLATLTDGSSTQPITSAPELAKINVSGSNKRFVYIGTGEYLGNSDLPCPSVSCAWTPNSHVTQTQSMYGLVDPMDGTSLAAPLRNQLVAQTYATSGTTRTISSNTIDFSSKKGWYIDFTNGERIVADPAMAAGVLVFTSSVPSGQVCTSGGTSWLYAVDYKTGGQVAGAAYAGTAIENGMASRPVLIQLPDGTVKSLLRVTDGTTTAIGVPTSPSSGIARRISWRELVD